MGLIRPGQDCFEDYEGRIKRVSSAGFARLLH
jgi:hypothetical protein